VKITEPKASIVFFDGVCTLCNHSVKILIALDKKNLLSYSSLQGEKIKTLKIENNLNSIIFYDNGNIYTKSTAILKIFSRLGGLYKLMNIFYLLPQIVRDFLYDILAKYRYRIFGKENTCILAQNHHKKLFIP